jgi:hypothetical protein
MTQTNDLMRGVTIHHDHAAQQQLLQSFRSELPDHRTYLSGPLKQRLGGRRFHDNGEVEMAVCECFRIQEPDLYQDGNFKLLPRWNKCISMQYQPVLSENNDTCTSVE